MKNRKKLAAYRDVPGVWWTKGELNGEIIGELTDEINAKWRQAGK